MTRTLTLICESRYRQSYRGYAGWLGERLNLNEVVIPWNDNDDLPRLE